MKNLLLFILPLSILSCNGQNEVVSQPKVADQLVHFYNQQRYDSIFQLFSADMRTALPVEKTKEFFSQMQKENGPILKHVFKERKAFSDRYRTDHANAIYWMSISQDAKGKISGLYFTEYDGNDPDLQPSMKRNVTPLQLPFYGEWYVYWGGDTEAQNYHVISRAQKHAFDIVVVDEKGSSHKNDGKRNEDYYAFGQPLFAPCDAEVVLVTDEVNDNIPGEMNEEQVTGNTVVLKTAASEFLLFAHFKLNSIKVVKGQKVQKGMLLGLCGNSGNSSEPHLHFHIQDRENMVGSMGIKCYFEKLSVNGQQKKDYSPVKGDKIKNEPGEEPKK